MAYYHTLHSAVVRCSNCSIFEIWINANNPAWIRQSNEYAFYVWIHIIHDCGYNQSQLRTNNKKPPTLHSLQCNVQIRHISQWPTRLICLALRKKCDIRKPTLCRASNSFQLNKQTFTRPKSLICSKHAYMKHLRRRPKQSIKIAQFTSTKNWTRLDFRYN